MLIAKLTKQPVEDVPDDHPEVRALSNITSECLVQKLWQMTDREIIEEYHRLLGLDAVSNTADKAAAALKASPYAAFCGSPPELQGSHG